jgi:C-terminal processing protease CtpA/Prc
MGYVRISQFSETTGDDLKPRSDLRKRSGAALKGLVLDLRTILGACSRRR